MAVGPAFLNYPTKPDTSRIRNMSFPKDLITSDRDIYIQISFQEYSGLSLLSGSYGDGGRDSIFLPMPKKLNDVPSVTWQAVDLASTATSLLPGRAATIAQLASMGGALFGYAINPVLWQLFKNPNFKKHSLTWSLTPNSPDESEIVRQIVRTFKYHMLPMKTGALYKYPSVAIVRFKSKDEFLYKFKPCVIEAMEVDHTGAGMPSFFKDNNAPTVTNLSINLLELDLWTKDNFNSYG